MPYFLVLLLVVSSMSALAAEPAKGPKDSLGSKSNANFLRELAKRVEGAGYNNVHMIPQMFVVLANRSGAQQTALIVDSKTLQAVEVEGALEFIGNATGTRTGTELPSKR
jgi:hypothetical protein